MLPVMFLRFLCTAASEEHAGSGSAAALDLKPGASLVELPCSSVVRMSMQNKAKSVQLLPVT